MEAEIREASRKIFGTEDYDSVLSILPAYDGAVREFRRQEREIRKKYLGKEDE